MLAQSKTQRNIQIAYSTRSPKTERNRADLATKAFRNFKVFSRWLKRLAGPAPRKEGPYIICGPTLQDHSHEAANIGNLNVFGFEYDGQPGAGGPSLAEVIAWLEEKGIAAIGFETWQHGVEDMVRWRVFIQLSRPIRVNGHDEVRYVYDYVATKVSDEFGIMIGHESKNHNRIWYTPRWPEGETRAILETGQSGALAIETVLAWHADNAHLFRIPARAKGKPVNQDDTTPIGWFNSQEDILRQLLSEDGYWFTGVQHDRKTGLMVERWGCPYDKGKTPGVMIFEQKDGSLKVFSHHQGKDPLANEDGQAHDAFSVYTVLQHGGNERAALEAVRAEMVWGREEQEEEPVQEKPRMKEQPTKVEDFLPHMPTLIRSLAQQMCECVNYPQPPLALPTAIFTFGCGINLHYCVENIYANIFQKNIGGSSSGKDGPLTISINYMRGVFGLYVMSRVTGRQALEDHISNAPGYILIRAVDENRAIGEGIGDEIADLENELFTAPQKGVMLRGKANSDKPKLLPCVFYARIATGTMEANFSERSMKRYLEGEGGRTAHAVTHRKRPDVQKQKVFAPLPEIVEWYEALPGYDIAEDGKVKTKRLELSGNAERHWFRRQKPIDRQMDSGQNDDLDNAMMGRVGEYAKRYALIFTIVDNPRATEIPLKWMRLGYDYAVFMAQWAKKEVHGQMGSNEIIRLADHMLRYVQTLIENKDRTSQMKAVKSEGQKEDIRDGYIPRVIIAQNQKRLINSKQLREIEETLVDRGDIKLVKRGPKDKPRHCWRLV
jgi:hypothetical protein